MYQNTNALNAIYNASALDEKAIYRREGNVSFLLFSAPVAKENSGENK